MKRSFGKWLAASVAALFLVSFAMAPYAVAASRGGGGPTKPGGAGGAGGAGKPGGAGGAGGAGKPGGAGGADSRTNNVRSGSSNSVNNVNVDRSVEVEGGWDHHPAAGVAVVGAAAAVGAAAGAAAATPNCQTVYSGGVAVQQCQ